jgi:uncharacterized membrane protein
MMLENVIRIDAPQDVVWNVTVDVENWPQWTPTVKSVKRLDEGPFACGSAALIQQPGLPEAKWVVTALISGERFTWESRILGIRMIGTHELSTKDTGTQSALRVEMSGIVARLLWPLICSSARRSLEQENAGLKAKCEALATQ